jgi:hypothetical protein
MPPKDCKPRNFLSVSKPTFTEPSWKKQHMCHFHLTYSRRLCEYPVSHCAHNLSLLLDNPSFTTSEASSAQVAFQNLWKGDLNIWASTYGQCYTFFVIISLSLSLSLSHTHTHTHTITQCVGLNCSLCVTADREFAVFAAVRFATVWPCRLCDQFNWYNPRPKYSNHPPIPTSRKAEMPRDWRYYPLQHDI